MTIPTLTRRYQKPIVSSVHKRFGEPATELSVLEKPSYQSKVDPQTYHFFVVSNEGPLYLVTAKEADGALEGFEAKHAPW